MCLITFEKHVRVFTNMHTYGVCQKYPPLSAPSKLSGQHFSDTLFIHTGWRKRSASLSNFPPFFLDSPKTDIRHLDGFVKGKLTQLKSKVRRFFCVTLYCKTHLLPSTHSRGVVEEVEGAQYVCVLTFDVKIKFDGCSHCGHRVTLDSL